MLAARHDDDDDILCVCVCVYMLGALVKAPISFILKFKKKIIIFNFWWVE